MKLHHIAIGAHDVESLASFYATVFQLDETKRHLYDDGRVRSIWFDCHGITLMIEGQTLGRLVNDLLPDERLPGCFITSFTLEEDKLDFLKRLASFHIKITHRTDSTLYFQDIEGNRCAVSKYPDII